MPRTTNRLSARTVATLKKPGRHADRRRSLPLHLARWLAPPLGFLYRWREPGEAGPASCARWASAAHPGSANSVASAPANSPPSARAHADGRNPLAMRSAEPEKRVPTFGEIAEEVISSLETGWRNPKHRDQWRTTLTRYCEPLRRARSISVTTEQVLAILKPPWTKVPETASRLRGRIEKVLDAARGRGPRTAENPARWRGHLDHLLPKRQKLTRGHHKALPYQEVPAFIGPLAAEQVGERAAWSSRF